MNLSEKLTYLGGHLHEHTLGGFEISLSPRLRARLGTYTPIPSPIVRLSDVDLTIGTPLTRAIDALYQRETERRAGYDPDAMCVYCGTVRSDHDRVQMAWEFCQRQVRAFASMGGTA